MYVVLGNAIVPAGTLCSSHLLLWLCANIHAMPCPLNKRIAALHAL